MRSLSLFTAGFLCYARVDETVGRGGFFDDSSERIKERKYNYSHVLAAAFQREIVQDISIVQKQ